VRSERSKIAGLGNPSAILVGDSSEDITEPFVLLNWPKDVLLSRFGSIFRSEEYFSEVRPSGLGT